MLTMQRDAQSPAKILVLGVGGGGGNAVNTMIKYAVEGVEYMVINTDLQVLNNSLADNKVQIGVKKTGGLGAGGDPKVGSESAEENISEIENMLEGADMVFIAAGMGGGTGTGAAPVIAKVAKDKGILTVAVVTKPFLLEGPGRAEYAQMGIGYLKEYVDSLVIIPNDRLLDTADPSITFVDALKMVDEVLMKGVKGISDIITKPGMVNLDFADVKNAMTRKGVAHMGIGTAKGENRVRDAVKEAIESPLLESSINGANTLLINITGGTDFGLLEYNDAATIIQEAAGYSKHVYVGTAIDNENMLEEGEISITVIATGFDEDRPPVPVGVRVGIVPDEEPVDSIDNADNTDNADDDIYASDGLENAKSHTSLFSEFDKEVEENYSEENEKNDYVIPEFLRGKRN